jgi:hypothetical protein
MYAWNFTSISTPRAALSACALLIIGALYGCSVSPGKAGDYGALRAAGVVSVASRTDITEHKVLYQQLSAEGVDDAGMVDGLVIAARVLCCRPDLQNSGPVVIYNPLLLKVAPGDLIEFRVGGPSSQTHKDALNVATRVLQQADVSNGACWWEPRNDRLWMRFIYCNWMQKDGWVKQENAMNPAWYKPADNQGTQ